MSTLADDLPIQSFASAHELRAWLEANYTTSKGIWLRITEGTQSARNRARASALIAAGRMTAAGLRALGLDDQS